MKLPVPLLRALIFLAPTKLAAIASRAYFMARASRFCSLPPPLWSQPRSPRSSADSRDTSAESGSKLARAFTDLFLSLPWLFLLITVRALMPLNVSPLVSVLITFLILGLLGWAASARVLSTSADALRNSDFVLQARASGLHGPRLFLIHVLPNLKPVLYAQFWISIPVFILSEANLGVLGLGVAEPLPSWGSLLRELEGMISFRDEPWRLVPLLLLIVVLTSFQLLLSNEEVTA